MRKPILRLNAIMPVIPPGVRALGLLEQPKASLSPSAEKRVQRLALGRREVDLLFPQRRIVHVAGLGRDVVVADDREPG